MSTFSPTDAAFEGFRLTREKPKAFMIWAGFQLIVSLVVGVAMITLAGPELLALENSGATRSNDPAVAMAAFGALMPVYAVLLPVGLIVQSVMAAAVFRAILRPSEEGHGYLKLGADELRLALLTVIYAALAIASVFVVALGAGIAAAILGSVSGQWAALVGAAVGVFAFGVLVWLAVRLSLAAAMTFDHGRLRVFDSWKLTRGHFWSLLGAYVLATVLAIVVFLLALVIISAVAAVATGGDLRAVGAIFRPDTSSLKAYFQPAMIIYTVLSAFMSAFNYAITFAPPAVAYKELNATSGETFVPGAATA